VLFSVPAFVLRAHIEIDAEKLEELLGVPMIPTVAIKGTGISKLLEKAVQIIEKGPIAKHVKVKCGDEVEERIVKLIEMVEGTQFYYPPRYVAIKLLEGDEEIEREVNRINPQIVSTAKKLANEVENLHGHSCSTVITSERYEVAGCVAREASARSLSKDFNLDWFKQ